MKPHWLSKLCVRAVAALQCEVCTQRTAACDCQSYDSFKNSWSSSVVTLPFPSEFNFISPCLSCRAILPSHPQTEPLTFIILALNVSHQIPYYLSVPHSLLSALLVSHVDLKLEEEKEVSDNHHAVTDKQKKKALASLSMEGVERKKENNEWESCRWQEWEQKQSSSRWRQRMTESDTTVMWGWKNVAYTRPVSWFYYYLR